MGEIGGFLGWATVMCFGLSVCTFIVKRLNTMVVSKLDKDSKVRGYFMILMRILIKYHMIFGISAGTLAVIHYFIQTNYEGGSIVGTVTTAAMVLVVAFGGVVKASKGDMRKKVIRVHRILVMSVIVLIILHLIVH